MSPGGRRAVVLALVGAACEFGPLEPPAPFRAGVYEVAVTVDDGCEQIDVTPAPAMDCRAGLALVEDDALSVAWPEVVDATYVVHDDAVPNIGQAPVLRWSTSGIVPSTVCDSATLRWVMTLTNDDDGKLSGSLRNTWSGLTGCPVTPEQPTADCTTAFIYRYSLDEPCEDPCTLVDTVPTPEQPYDCGLSTCECP